VRYLRQAGLEYGVPDCVRLMFEIEDPTVKPAMSRTELEATLQDGSQSRLPDLLHKWLNGFKQKLPQELQEFNLKEAASFDITSSEDAMKEFAKRFREMALDAAKYKRSKDAEESATGDIEQQEEFPKDKATFWNKHAEKERFGDGGGKTRKTRKANPTNKHKAQNIGRFNEPTVFEWKKSEGNVDLPAEFDENQNKLYMNPSYQRFVDEVSFWADKYPTQNRNEIEEVVKLHFCWVIQQLIMQWRTRQVGLDDAEQMALIRGSGMVAAICGSFYGIRLACKSHLREKFPRSAVAID
jgi:hypothetical protein